MGLILDTSSVIGRIELQHVELIDWLRETAENDPPKIHAVTVGELEHGIAAADNDAVKRDRRATLSFCNSAR